MIITGIVAEYNPLHEGHKYHINESIKATHSDYIVVALSGNFCQRGTPAFLDKMTRAKMALLAGADLVVEIPTLYSTSQAEDYAKGSVATLNALGCVDNLCFGMESKYTEELAICASTIRNLKGELKDSIVNSYKSGKSYAQALSEIITDENLLTPNNILGIEYINAIYSLGSSIKPYGITRLGDYSSEVICSPDSKSFSSASAIRKSIEEDGFDYCMHEIPEECRELLQNTYGQNGPIFVNDFSEQLRYKLILDLRKGYEDYLGIDRSLSDRIKNNIDSFTNYEDFTSLIKTRNVTYSHVSRALLHILLNIKKEQVPALDNRNCLSYVRVLGFKENATPLLKEIKATAKADIIYTAEDYKNHILKENDSLIQSDILATNLYNSVIKQKYGKTLQKDFAASILKI